MRCVTWLVMVFAVACGGTEAPALDIQIDSGTVHGKQVGTVRKFLGIPYAAPPVGDNRWRAPQRVAPWSDVRDALSIGNVCPQVNPFGPGGGDEDCLYLNVFVPAVANKAAVMFWVHGGAFVFGSGSETYYDGAKLAKSFGVVVVTINYRLGALGTLAHPALASDSTGNYGLEDQLAALEWVQRNIGAFGGDPTNVTLFGESAGGFSTCIHYVSPATHGLFRRAIVESGLCTSGFERSKATAVSDSMTLATALGCTTNIAACMRAKTPEELNAAITPPPVAMQPPGGPLYLTGPLFPAPFVDGKVVVSDLRVAFAAGNFEPRPILFGTNRDEGTLFHSVILAQVVNDDQAYRAALTRKFGASNVDAIVAHYPTSAFASPNAAIAAVTGDSLFVCPARRVARGVVAAGANAFRYSFERPFENPLVPDGGVMHSAEIPFVFGNDNFLLGQMGQSGLPVSARIQHYWTNFAKYGDPNDIVGDLGKYPEPITWPHPDNDMYLKLDLTTVASSGLKPALCDFWDQLQF